MPLEIDDSVRKLNLAAPKAKELFNHANRLIEALERRNEWVLCVVGFFPDLPEILHPEVSTWHCFKKVKHHFLLRHVWQRDVWHLSVAKAPQDNRPPPRTVHDGRRAPRRRQRPDDNGARAAAVRRPPRSTKKRVAEWFARIPTDAQIKSYLYKIVDNVAGSAKLSFAHAKTSIAAIKPLARELFTIAQPSAGTSKLEVEYPVQESYGHARYERRTFKIGHMTLELTTEIRERARWEDWLFGRLIEERELSLA